MTNYDLKERLGAGGFGEVFRAVRRVDNADCAIKRCLAAPTDLEARQRFTREVRLLADLSHPQIVPVLDMHLDDDPPWYVMPLGSGSLRSLLPQVKGDIRHISRLFAQILDGIEHAHAKGIIHRDLKPDNVIVFRDSGNRITLRLADFGLAKHVNLHTLSLTIPLQGMGTLFYAAPEQMDEAKTVDHRADIFALGKMLAELLTGDLPVNVNPGNLKGVRGNAYVIAKCLEQTPERRYQSIHELREDIVRFFDEQTAKNRKTPVMAFQRRTWTSEPRQRIPPQTHEYHYIVNNHDQPIVIISLRLVLHCKDVKWLVVSDDLDKDLRVAPPSITLAPGERHQIYYWFTGARIKSDANHSFWIEVESEGQRYSASSDMLTLNSEWSFAVQPTSA